MSKKKIEKTGIIKSMPTTFSIPPKAIKLAKRFAKENPKLRAIKNKALEEKQKIEPLIKQSKDGSYVSSQAKGEFNDLVQLIINIK